MLKSMKLHIGIFEKRNVGKSSLLNSLTKQDVSIVSNKAGTTTDAVEKSMELLPLGPVLFVDTAGIDDIGALGLKRIEKTKQVIDRTDLAIIVCDYNGFNEFEESLIKEFKMRKIPFIIVINKIDEGNISVSVLEKLKIYEADIVKTSVKIGEGIED